MFINHLPKWQEEEFLHKLPYKLIKSEKGYNLKCPICGDSKVKEYKNIIILVKINYKSFCNFSKENFHKIMVDISK